MVAKLAVEKDVQVTDKRFHEPKQTEKTGDLFVTFAEVEFLTTTLDRLMELCFQYMPSSLEVVEPSEFRFSLNDANAMLNVLLARLHKYDEIAKTMILETQMLQNRLNQSQMIGVQNQTISKPSKESGRKKSKRKK